MTGWFRNPAARITTRFSIALLLLFVAQPISLSAQSLAKKTAQLLGYL